MSIVCMRQVSWFDWIAYWAKTGVRPGWRKMYGWMTFMSSPFRQKIREMVIFRISFSWAKTQPMLTWTTRYGNGNMWYGKKANVVRCEIVQWCGMIIIQCNCIRCNAIAFDIALLPNFRLWPSKAFNQDHYMCTCKMQLCLRKHNGVWYTLTFSFAITWWTNIGPRRIEYAGHRRAMRGRPRVVLCSRCTVYSADLLSYDGIYCINYMVIVS